MIKRCKEREPRTRSRRGIPTTRPGCQAPATPPGCGVSLVQLHGASLKSRASSDSDPPSSRPRPGRVIKLCRSEHEVDFAVMASL